MLHASAVLTAIFVFGGLIVTAGASAWQLRQAHFHRDEELQKLRWELAQERRAHVEEIIQILLEQFVRLAQRVSGQPNANIRSCVFLPRSDRLVIVYHSNMNNAPDLGIEFERWQGCAGHAWVDCEQVKADLSLATKEQLHQTWKLSPAQISITSHLKSVLCTPIRSPQKTDIILGVVSIDSDADLPSSRFDQDDFLVTALQVSEALARLLLVGAIPDQSPGKGKE